MQGKAISRLVFALMMMLIVVSGIAIAQDDEENLLSNPGFESSFGADGVASDWESWSSDAEDAPAFQEEPQYFAATNTDSTGLNSQIRSGNDAQAMFSFFTTHEAGIYQQVSGLTDGMELRFSIYAHVFSNRTTNIDASDDPGGVTIRVGIDPTGGTDPFSPDIEYTEPFIDYDRFIQYSTIAEAEGDTVTVFVRSLISEPVQNTIVFFDDAVLNVTPESQVPTDEPTAESTDEPTAEPTDEPTEEPTDEPTAEPTDEPTEEPTDEPTAEPTDEPTAEPTDEPTEDPTPTREGEPTAESTDEVTEEPTDEPTAEPTDEPSATPTDEPTAEPTEDVPISETFPGQILHTVQRGDTVGRLASRYGSSTEAIIQANGLDDSALIFVGQGLVIPVRIVPATETPSATPVVIIVTATPTPAGVDVSATPDEPDMTEDGLYVVVPGDNLLSIARRFNTTVGALVQLNGIANPNRILVGQVLRIPGAGGNVTPTATPPEAPEVTDESETVTPEPTPEPVTTYVVQPGNNLYRIALRNEVSITALAAANNITNFNLIFVGQVLIIP